MFVFVIGLIVFNLTTVVCMYFPMLIESPILCAFSSLCLQFNHLGVYEREREVKINKLFCVNQIWGRLFVRGINELANISG